MEVFSATLNQMIILFTFITLGFVLRKLKILPEGSDTAMSRLEVYIFCPALALSSWINNCTVETLSKNYINILYGAGIMLFAILISPFLAKLFVPKNDTPELCHERNVYRYSMMFGNFGFVGGALALGIGGEEMYFYYSMFSLTVNFFCYAVGVPLLIPQKQTGSKIKAFFSRLLVPATIAVFVGLILGLLNAKEYMPVFVKNLLSQAGACMSPVAMLLAGFVIGGFDLKELITRKKVYIAALLRLIVIPAIMVLLLRAFGASDLVMTLALICFAAPLGLNTVVYPAAYGSDVKTGASMAVVSHTLAVITLPIMYLIFIVLL